MIEIGKKAPAFKLKDQHENVIELKSFLGKKLVLYFYPKDNTSGCTQEACDFRDSIKAFESLGVTVLGLSPDSTASHKKFAEKFGLKFSLLADEGKEVLEKYGVWKEKSMYGRKYMGVERTTVVIDEAGKILNIYAKVKVGGHIDELKAFLKSLK
jgi:thioredoxin-dependent peroxiredoxin